jgi:ribosomal protein S18 acetylase RimI-like enzyme
VTDPDFTRALKLIRAVQDRSAEQRYTTGWGTALWRPEIPAVWDLNILRIEQDPGDLTAGRLAAQAERLQGAVGLAHRNIMVADEQLGRRLAPGFRALGWAVVRHSVLIYRPTATTVTVAADAPVVELPGERVRELRAETFRRDLAPLAPDVLEQLLAYDRLLDRTVSIRHFAAHVGGTPVSACKLIGFDRVGQVEDVVTLAEHRRRGLATAVVSRAVAASRELGDALTFIVADEDDWPRLLYQRLGFAHVGRIHLFRRLPLR